MNEMLNTPVLFLVFNRLDTTKLVFKEIAQAKPIRLYVASDGPRDSVLGEVDKVIAVREFIIKNIDWDCDVRTLFRKKNLGCKNAVSGAISWFFEQEEAGIILEDDCLPSQSFFVFCSELLNRYATDSRIMSISGNNFSHTKSRSKYSYYFGKYFHCWGWATWKRAWEYYDDTIEYVNEIFEAPYEGYTCFDKSEKKYMKEIVKQLENNQIDTWDWRFHFSILKQNGLNIHPNDNLVMNIGAGEGATHSKKESCFHFVHTNEIKLPLVHPPFFIRSFTNDKLIKDAYYSYPLFFNRIVKKMRRLSQIKHSCTFGRSD